MRLIDADKLSMDVKTLPIMSNWGEVFIPNLINEQPTIDAIPMAKHKECVKEVKDKIPKALYDQISEKLLADQCSSVWIACMECLSEMADAWEEVNGRNLVWIPGHYESRGEKDG